MGGGAQYPSSDPRISIDDRVRRQKLDIPMPPEALLAQQMIDTGCTGDYDSKNFMVHLAWSRTPAVWSVLTESSPVALDSRTPIERWFMFELAGRRPVACPQYIPREWRFKDPVLRAHYTIYGWWTRYLKELPFLPGCLACGLPTAMFGYLCGRALCDDCEYEWMACPSGALIRWPDDERREDAVGEHAWMLTPGVCVVRRR